MLGLGLLVSAADELSAIQSTNKCNNRQLCIKESASAGWLVFLVMVLMVYELLTLVARFLNFSFMSIYSNLVLIVVRQAERRVSRVVQYPPHPQDMTVSGTMALCLLIGGSVQASILGFSDIQDKATEAAVVSLKLGHACTKL